LTTRAHHPTTVKAGRQAIPKGREVEELVAAIGRFCEGWNQRCQPFRWTKDADQILTQFERQTLQGRTTRRLWRRLSSVRPTHWSWSSSTLQTKSMSRYYGRTVY
jgi:hypothetical protein